MSGESPQYLNNLPNYTSPDVNYPEAASLPTPAHNCCGAAQALPEPALTIPQRDTMQEAGSVMELPCYSSSGT